MHTNLEALNALTPDQRLCGRTAIVTGSSSGIGEAIARVLAASGAEVLITGRDRDRVQAVTDTITRAEGAAHPMTVDLGAHPDALRAFAQDALKALGGHVDILVNNAGNYPMGATDAIADSDIDAILNTNIRAPHTLVAAFAPGMAERGHGAIVNISSWTARAGIPLTGMYAASKAALEQLTRVWAAEYGPSGIRVNSISPGVTVTPGNESSADIVARIAEGTAAGKAVRPVDIGYAVRYLVSDEALFLHGATIDVDGGIAHTRIG